MKIVASWFKFHWKLFPMEQMTTSQHWLRYRLGAAQVYASFELKLTESYILFTQWFNTLRAIQIVVILPKMISNDLFCMKIKCWIFILIPLKFVPKVLVNKKSKLVDLANGLVPIRRQAIICTNQWWPSLLTHAWYLMRVVVSIRKMASHDFHLGISSTELELPS